MPDHSIIFALAGRLVIDTGHIGRIAACSVLKSARIGAARRAFDIRAFFQVDTRMLAVVRKASNIPLVVYAASVFRFGRTAKRTCTCLLVTPGGYAVAFTALF